MSIGSNLPYTGSDWQKKPFSDFGVSNLVAKSANLVACFFKIVIICVFFGEIPDYRGLKCALIAPIGRRNSDFYGLLVAETKNRGYKLRRNPVDFTSALNPVEYDLVVGGNLTPNAVLPDTDTIIILKTPHLVDIEITGKGYLMPGIWSKTSR